jgi:hypothetical protein
VGYGTGWNEGELLSDAEISIQDLSFERLNLGSATRGRGRGPRSTSSGTGDRRQRERSLSPQPAPPRRRAAVKGKPKGRPTTAHGPRSKQWAWTLNNYTDADVRRIQGLVRDPANKIEYLVFQPEKEETPHLQGYIVFENRKRMSTVKTTLGTQRVHLEVVRGSPTENRGYCTDVDKIDDTAGFGIFEWGNIPTSHNMHGKSQKLNEVMMRIDNGMHMWDIPVEVPEYRSTIAANYRLIVTNQ